MTVRCENGGLGDSADPEALSESISDYPGVRAGGTADPVLLPHPTSSAMSSFAFGVKGHLLGADEPELL